MGKASSDTSWDGMDGMDGARGAPWWWGVCYVGLWDRWGPPAGWSGVGEGYGLCGEVD